jgi:hypothetical protein
MGASGTDRANRPAMGTVWQVARNPLIDFVESDGRRG